jgi:hypothetical protein
MHRDVPLGGTMALDRGARFLVWAPHHERIGLDITAPEKRLVEMQPVGEGYHFVTVPDLGPGTRYFYRLGKGNGDRIRHRGRSLKEFTVPRRSCTKDLNGTISCGMESFSSIT